MKQIEVKIMGQAYLLGAPEGGEARLHAAVQRVDAAMCKIRDAGKIKARDRIAVLAALNLAFDIADREAADLAAERAQPAGHAHTIGSTSQPSDASTDDQQLQALVRRLDDALGEDGRLL